MFTAQEEEVEVDEFPVDPDVSHCFVHRVIIDSIQSKHNLQCCSADMPFTMKEEMVFELLNFQDVHSTSSEGKCSLSLVLMN